jgi:nucleotide-binding universal stress UspA family protein
MVINRCHAEHETLVHQVGRQAATGAGRDLSSKQTTRSAWRLPVFQKLLVPTDGSDMSINAALRAIPLAEMAGASITVLFVQEPYPYRGIGEASRAGMQAHMAAVRADGMRAFECICDAAKAKGVPIDTLVVENDQPETGIVEGAQSVGADLIVMGSHGRSGVAKLVLGSVAAKVLALSRVPVLIIK